jgi:hypothetical protein
MVAATMRRELNVQAPKDVAASGNRRQGPRIARGSGIYRCGRGAILFLPNNISGSSKVAGSYTRWNAEAPTFINQRRDGARLVWLTVADCRSACHAGGVAFRAGPSPSWKVAPGPPLALIVPGSVARSRCERLRPGRPIYPGHRLRLLVATTINSRISSAVKACIEQSCRGTADEVADR